LVNRAGPTRHVGSIPDPPQAGRARHPRPSSPPSTISPSVVIRTPDSDASIGFVSTYPQTVCGLASYTAALIGGIAGYRGSRSGLGVVDLNDSAIPSTTGDVAYQHRIGDRHSLETAIRVLNGFDAVSIQHEFGIFGGRDGDEVIDLIAGITVPTAVTFHTVLEHPSEHQRMIIDDLCAHADRLVVMSGIASQRLASCYGVDPARIDMIPHGVDTGFGGPSLVNGGRPLVLTWGLIGPGKGLESAIEAFAGLTDLASSPRYLISGATHPRVREKAGESYREGLVALARRHELENVVEFDDRYVDREALARLVRSADLVVLPYESVEQLTSGVLVEAIAAGKPVVATAFPHAVELLSGGAGVVVPHGDTAALRAAIGGLLSDGPARSAMAREARRLADGWDWPVIGQRFGAMISEMASTRRSERTSAAPARHHAVA